ncbi:MAG: hypothetical protein KKA73_13640 [Chloroflexi bacterium]|nr:hypothetical protein [Chloroflexota bacterium]
MTMLRDDQHEFVRWLVEQVRAGNTSGTFSVRFSANTQDGHIYDGFKRGVDRLPVPQGILETLAAANMLVIKRLPKGSLSCTITQNAFDAVDSDFGEGESTPTFQSPFSEQATNEQSHGTAEIRKLLNAAFDDVGLIALCQDEFPKLCDSLARGLRKDEIILVILDHFRRLDDFSLLLDAVKARRPDQYARFFNSSSLEPDERGPIEGVQPPYEPAPQPELGKPYRPKSLWGRTRETLGSPVWQGIGAIVGIVACVVAFLVLPPIQAVLWPVISTPTSVPTSIRLSPTATPLGSSRYIAFESDCGGNWDIYMMNVEDQQIDCSKMIRLTRDPADDRSPAWSPDGRHIAFTSKREGYAQIYVMGIGDEPEKTASPIPIPLKGLTACLEPVWSPDGSHIAFAAFADPENSEIFVMSEDGSEVKRLTDHANGDRHPAWSPDGRRIAFQSKRDGNLDIYTMNADGTELKRLTYDPAEDRDAVWSPSSTRIVFVRVFTDTQGSEIWSMNADGSGQTRLTYSGGDYSPTWSPDGQHIAFVSNRDAPEGIEIYIMNSDGSEQKRWTYSSARNYYPTWSPR